MQQNLTITYMKATGIMLMVLAHCSNFELLYRIVYSFHMPLFFIVSGYCFKEKYLHEPITFVWKRLKGLWCPFVKWGLFFLILHNIFFHWNIYNDKYGFHGIVQHLYSIDDFINHATSILLMTQTECLLGGYWFLNALFWGSLIAFVSLICCHLLSKTVKHGLLEISLGGVIVLCLLINYFIKTFTLFLIGPQAFISAAFFMVGYIFAKRKVPKFKSWQSLLAFSIMIVNSFYNLIEIANPFNDTIRIVPYMITAVFGTWCVYSLPWQRLSGKVLKAMEYIGNHTLTILTWHFLCFKIVSLIIIFVHDLPIERLAEFPAIGEYSNRGWFLLYTIVGIGLPLLMTYLWENLKYKIVVSCHSQDYRYE